MAFEKHTRGSIILKLARRMYHEVSRSSQLSEDEAWKDANPLVKQIYYKLAKTAYEELRVFSLVLSTMARGKCLCLQELSRVSKPSNATGICDNCDGGCFDA